MRSLLKKNANRQEKELSKALGAKLTPASGAFAFNKGDMKTDEWLIESKATEKPSYSLTKKVLEKIEREAIKDHRLPLLILELQGRRYYIFREGDI